MERRRSGQCPHSGEANLSAVHRGENMKWLKTNEKGQVTI
jgi:hypothetical protein